MAWDYYKQEPLKLQFEVLPVGWIYHQGPFPNLDSKLLLKKDLTALFKSGCRSAPFGDIYAVTFLYCFFSFNACVLKLSKIIYETLKLFMCVISGFSC